jgi:peptidoglycan/LPS O-acetylase OafA/YrhL
VVNIKFWLEADYWAPSSSYKPLLHFWSLALEEQFYAITFIILLFLNRLKIRQIFPQILAVLAVAGAFISIFLDVSASFYLIFSRFYLFVLGFYFASGRYYSGLLISLVCILSFSINDVHSAKILEIIPILFFLAGHAIGKTDFSPFESSAISFVIRYLGLRSYCIYLVHWPVIVIWRVLFGGLQDYELIITILVMGASELLFQLFDKHHEKLGALFNNVPPKHQIK